VILDLMLPDINGFDVCRSIRSEDSMVPILMLTAKAEEVDIVLGLELGADEYLTKPFSVRELIARVRALLRRVETDRRAGDINAKPSELVFDTLKIVPASRSVSVAERPVELTAKEYDLLECFALNPGRAYTRTELLEEVWGTNFEGYDHTVNSLINRLRQKIETDPSNPRYIKTLWGVGYRFANPSEVSE
jgi:DNA-binding response OmpR family regulator